MNRSLVFDSPFLLGFDHTRSLIERAAKAAAESYPPYNVEDRGEGALRIGGKTRGYYRSVAASYGLQAGIQKFGYALFFLSDDDLKYLKSSGGWEIGVGPSVVVVDEGMARSFTTTTARSGVYAFFFNQKGLMAGLGIQGSKITEIHPGK